MPPRQCGEQQNGTIEAQSPKKMSKRGQAEPKTVKSAYSSTFPAVIFRSVLSLGLAGLFGWCCVCIAFVCVTESPFPSATCMRSETKWPDPLRQAGHFRCDACVAQVRSVMNRLVAARCAAKGSPLPTDGKCSFAPRARASSSIVCMARSGEGFPVE